MKRLLDLQPSTWGTLRELLDTGMALAPEVREAWLRTLPPEHQPLAPRLRSLLRHQRALDTDPFGTLPKIDTADFAGRPVDGGGQADPAAGSVIGPYRLLRRLGEGGMGSVWLAERADGLLQRPVALKLPRLHTDRPALAERIARERGFLAALDHPHIARLYDAGLTAAGHPYLALEYVEGERIDLYCSRRSLDLRAKLALFGQVAGAVAHAHARLIVHRDLKPANILVTATGQVRLLDFGIAKLVEGESAAVTELTQQTGRALTLEYASPEQVDGLALGTASDIYSLGVLLYELLAGQRPFAQKRGSRVALEDAILHLDPAPPSAVVAGAAHRKALRGDLDTIVLKALKKKPAERYSTVEAMADDVQRFLQQRPVLARPDSLAYRTRKFIVRYRGLVTIAATVLLLIIATAVVAAWQAQRATREQHRAEQVKAFIGSVLADADPYADEHASAATVSALLGRAYDRVERELSGEPEIRAELLRLLGKAYSGRFDLPSAERVLTLGLNETRALEATQEHRFAAAATAIELGEVKKQLGKSQEARALLLEALSVARPNPSDPRASDLYADAKTLEAGLALREGRYAEVVAAAMEVIRVSTQVHGEVNPRAAFAYGLIPKTRGFGAEHQRRSLEAARKAFELFARLYPTGDGRPHPLLIESRHDYGVALLGMGQLNAAEGQVAQALADAVELYGERNVMVGHFSARLGQIHLLRGELERGLREVRNANELLADIDPGQTIATAGRLRTQALGSLWLHRPIEAIEPLQRAVAILETRRDARTLLAARADYALALLETGREDEAAALLADVDDAASRLLPPERPLRALARLELARGHPAAAKSLLLRALEAARTDPRRPFEVDTLIDLARASFQLSEFDAARARAREALAELDRTAVVMTPHDAEAWSIVGRAHLKAGAVAAAVAALDRSARLWTDLAPGSPSAADNERWLAEARRASAAAGERATPRS